MATILIIDDDEGSREAACDALTMAGHTVIPAGSGMEGLRLLDEKEVEIVVTDLIMPNVDGLAVLARAKELESAPEVIILTGYGSIESAVESMRQGAFSYLNKPINIKELREVVKRALEKRLLTTENVELRRAVDKKYGFENLIGNSEAMSRIYDTVRQVAPTGVTVLITGESGTGKELIARAVHNNSARNKKPFMAVNCAAISEGILESELFGHEKGAFTGAHKDRKGFFELVEGGTIFLDEIGDMPLSTQSKLLRVLENREFMRVGGTKTVTVDVRVITATNKDLARSVKAGEFREDLFYRINVVSLNIPPLRDRREDIPPLVDHYVTAFAKEHNRKVTGVDGEAMGVLQSQDWPGNVRELKNMIENLVLTARGSVITPADLPSNLSGEAKAPVLSRPVIFRDDLTMDEIEREVIAQTLERCEGNRTKAAETLGIGLRTIHRKIKQYDLE